MTGRASRLAANMPGSLVISKEEEVRGERTEETNASTLVLVTSRVTISPKIHCEQTQM